MYCNSKVIWGNKSNTHATPCRGARAQVRTPRYWNFPKCYSVIHPIHKNWNVNGGPTNGTSHVRHNYLIRIKRSRSLIIESIDNVYYFQENMYDCVVITIRYFNYYFFPYFLTITRYTTYICSPLHAIARQRGS